MSTTELGPAFFLAVVVILVTCRITALALRGLGQPPVVGEMVAGVLLGPSLLGLLAPGVEEELFPEALRPVLFVAGQIGLVVFMFQAGYELRADRLRPVARAAGVISAAGMVVPLALGTGLAWAVHPIVDILPGDAPVPVSCLFVGVALAITAFPMLARIITERGLTGTRFGSISLAAGAVDDAVAWVLLAGVLSLSQDSAGPFAKAVAGTLGLFLMLALLLRAREPVARRLERLAPERTLLLVVLTLFLAAWYTDTIGLYAVFGAFSLGVVFPRCAAVDRAVGALAPAGQIVFLPLFFTYSGLNTDFGLLTGPTLLLVTAACVAAAVLGKFGACWLAARAVGEERGVALRVGTLMNARGLMQLIAINVGLSAGIVTQRMFSMLVVVALVTTLMATPILSLWDRRDRTARPPAADSREPVQELAPKAAETGP
ncbi:cation:proton antiporter [Streptomyces sp. AN091965]|uniref:cation:proton antiporter n=1 Tax=Streptomyces sp. AN091965 TaxID=2927803 RepID=UPI001F61C654|nr:cation:proton antiporter [Streptomyces sp. AN091965]MCI3928945.1 cation:proton antiporter [Streptomyces sp. AN091965]